METPARMPWKCYVLGAGFSHACGLPLARDLTKEVYVHTFDAPDVPALNDAANRRIGHMQYFFPTCDCNANWPDFEQLLTFVHEYQDFAADFHFAGGTISPTANMTPLENSLVHGLGTLLAQKAASVLHESMQCVQEFVNRALSEAASVISFNWDCLLEIACRNLKVKWSYNEREAHLLRVIKPHGSINLVETSERKYRENSAINVHSLVELELEEDRVVLMAQNPQDAFNRTLAPFATDQWLIVPPGARKSFHSPWIKKQWRFALEWLRQADEITVIGYSLPEFDVRSRFLFRLANVRRRAPALQIIDPNPATTVERLAALGYDSIAPVARPWQDWIGNGRLVKESHAARF